MTAGRKTNTGSIHWCTPEKYVTPITNFLGGISLDPCSNEDSIVGAEVQLLSGGIEHNWDNYETVYVNPPYGRNGKTSIYDWLKKCHITNSEIVALIPVAPNTKHWKEFVFNANVICFLADTRLKFLINGNTNNKGASMACCLIYWGNRREEFIDTFSEYGNCCAAC